MAAAFIACSFTKTRLTSATGTGTRTSDVGLRGWLLLFDPETCQQYDIEGKPTRAIDADRGRNNDI